MKMNSASPKSSLVKLGLQKQKPFRVMVLGQGGVGKTGRDFLEILCSNFQKTIITKFFTSLTFEKYQLIKYYVAISVIFLLEIFDGNHRILISFFLEKFKHLQQKTHFSELL
jgi:hypothetical protein